MQTVSPRERWGRRRQRMRGSGCFGRGSSSHPGGDLVYNRVKRRCQSGIPNRGGRRLRPPLEVANCDLKFGGERMAKSPRKIPRAVKRAPVKKEPAKKLVRSVELVPVERVERSILLIRGQKVILDSDLAVLFGVTTKRLNEQVRRNQDRFPP